MEFNKAMDNLPAIFKIVIVIFLPVLYVVYRFVADVLNNRMDLVILDILFCVVPFPFIFWLLNLISICVSGKVFSFEEWLPKKA